MRENAGKTMCFAIAIAAAATVFAACAKPNETAGRTQTPPQTQTQGKTAEMTAAGRWAVELGAKTTGENGARRSRRR